jgi:hypothetical protein
MIRIVLVFTLLASPALAQSVFSSSAAAQASCPGDTVVWLNTVRHIYRLPGQKGYGRSKSSAYACQKAADAAGDKVKKDKPTTVSAPRADTDADTPQ